MGVNPVFLLGYIVVTIKPKNPDQSQQNAIKKHRRMRAQGSLLQLQSQMAQIAPERRSKCDLAQGRKP